jgi:hypothetical protein
LAPDSASAVGGKVLAFFGGNELGPCDDGMVTPIPGVGDPELKEPVTGLLVGEAVLLPAANPAPVALATG